jgi:acetyl-CoA synthetase
VNVFYTAPTAIRTFAKWGDQWPKKHKMESLRLLGTVGEPINPEAWMWYREVIGHNRCPIVDTWWQTETGSIMITPLPGAIATKPGSATLPFFGVVPEIVTMEGKPVPLGSGGYLVIRQPWPSMLRTLYGDPDRYVQQYWSQIPGSYFTGDGARKDKDGYFWIMGRVDDVLNVSGHRLSTMEVESALVAHEKVAEAAVVGRPDEIKGQAISAFVSLEHGVTPTPALKEELKKWVVKEIGALARPDDIRFTDALPKTRSGKIMRRLLRELASSGEVKGDTTTLEDFGVIAKLKEQDEA